MINKKTVGLLYGSNFMLKDKENNYTCRLLGINRNGFYVNYYENTENLIPDIFIKLTDIGTDYHILARPYSDLTKLITHKGETFVPLFEVSKLSERYLYMGEYIQWDANDYGATPTYCLDNINEWPNEIIEKLREWNFALNLPEGSWIPVTNDNNPYK